MDPRETVASGDRKSTSHSIVQSRVERTSASLHKSVLKGKLSSEPSLKFGVKSGCVARMHQRHPQQCKAHVTEVLSWSAPGEVWGMVTFLTSLFYNNIKITHSLV